MEDVPVADARANLSEITAHVRHARQSVRLTRRGTPQATIVPIELGDAAEAIGGPDKATELLRQLAEARQETP
jgi:prevent-host-death family protein